MRQMDVVLLQDGRPGDASVENVGIKVRSIRPIHGIQFRICPDLREVGGVTQRLSVGMSADAARTSACATPSPPNVCEECRLGLRLLRRFRLARTVEGY